MTNAHLTRIVRFSSAHRYHRPDWSDEKNQAAFGACANAPGHGHNYRCAVTIKGPVDPLRGMIMDLSVFDALLHEQIVAPLDHQHINLVIPEFAYGQQIPTAEALAIYLWHRLRSHLPPKVRLATVRVEEDDSLYAEYHGD